MGVLFNQTVGIRRKPYMTTLGVGVYVYTLYILVSNTINISTIN